MSCRQLISIFPPFCRDVNSSRARSFPILVCPSVRGLRVLLGSLHGAVGIVGPALQRVEPERFVRRRVDDVVLDALYGHGRINIARALGIIE